VNEHAQAEYINVQCITQDATAPIARVSNLGCQIFTSCVTYPAESSPPRPPRPSGELVSSRIDEPAINPENQPDTHPQYPADNKPPIQVQSTEGDDMDVHTATEVVHSFISSGPEAIGFTETSSGYDQGRQGSQTSLYPGQSINTEDVENGRTELDKTVDGRESTGSVQDTSRNLNDSD